MNPLVFHIVSGDAFFSAILLLVVTLFWPQQRWQLLHRVCLVTGILLIAMVAAPSSFLEWSLILGAMGLVVLIGFRGSEQQKSVAEKSGKASLMTLRHIAVMMLIALGISELIWRVNFSPLGAVPRRLIIFGDSVTAGIGENEAVTWPNLLQQEQNLDVLDYSEMGATIGSELKKLPFRELPGGLVLIELGGNDILGQTSVEDFRDHLQDFFGVIREQYPAHAVVMFELPFPPGFNRFGMEQRRMARQFQIRLIPKRRFLQVLAAQEATLDSIHLSQAGHRQMQKAVWSEIQTAFVKAETSTSINNDG